MSDGDQSDRVRVTDHAVERYLERGSMGDLAVIRGGRLDIAATRAAIAAVCRRGARAHAKAVLYDRVRFVLKADHGEIVVVTALARRGGSR
ncbi:hypothetical protein [Segnochrobactrum spirostomi]|uniref:Uncharacterized protein n=1 Tax=Segnochrobactrum spirostomi TaxID=2608987 RepID=A0A6A7Y7M9_9HYPH|nr:hypothetical protein [Segnochrobactrum spirostomi]MQT13662.1 hypothetical protein [Segnochrobactrum spirostomi]